LRDRSLWWRDPKPMVRNLSIIDAETGDRTFLDIIQRYEDCRATRHVKDWLSNFVQDTYLHWN